MRILQGLGRRPFTLVFEDSTGNSDIFHKEAVREPLRSEEVAELRAPERVIDLQNLRFGGPGSEG